jgi:hypothetical protein
MALSRLPDEQLRLYAHMLLDSAHTALRWLRHSNLAQAQDELELALAMLDHPSVQTRR